MNKLSPVLLFVYNRPAHTRETVNALKMCEEAKVTDLVIYSDAAKTDEDQVLVGQVREYLLSIEGFKSIRVELREVNVGLADNVIGGISKEIQRSGRVIVLEDDIVVSPSFLCFMNVALDRYRDNYHVWHISGWNYPVASSGLQGAFFMRLMNCWGWATWSDRWSHFERNPEKLLATIGSEDIKRFNLDGAHDFWFQVVANKEGVMRTWAVFWYATIFNHEGLCLTTTQPLVKNIGFDGSGVHCGSDDLYKVHGRSYEVSGWPDVFEENKIAVRRIKWLLRRIYQKRRIMSVLKTVWRRLKK